MLILLPQHFFFNYHFLTANSNTNLSFSRLTDERLKDGHLMPGADKSINFIFEEKKPQRNGPLLKEGKHILDRATRANLVENEKILRKVS